MTPRVTVLLAVRDGEPFLRQALDSVLGQTFSDLELLVVDDASTDGTPQLLASLTDPRLRVLRNETNLGQVPSLNRGLREARGEYVARLDHDDVCRADRLARQVAVLDREPQVAVVGSWATIVDEQGHVLGHARQSLRDFVDFLYRNLVAWVLIPHPSATFRRDVVLELGGYDETLGPSEDKDLWRRLALRRFEARIVEEELIDYRLHTTQLSRVHEERQRRHDVESHRAFLRELAGDAVDVERLRLLLVDDPGFFAAAGDGEGVLRDLDALLAAAAERVELAPDERTRLERLVRRRVARVALGGWRHDPDGWRLASAPLARYGGAGAAAAYAAVRPAAPMLAAASRAARRAARAAVASQTLRRFEERARRSPLARRLYSLLIRRP